MVTIQLHAQFAGWVEALAKALFNRHHAQRRNPSKNIKHEWFDGFRRDINHLEIKHQGAPLPIYVLTENNKADLTQ